MKNLKEKIIYRNFLINKHIKSYSDFKLNNNSNFKNKNTVYYKIANYKFCDDNGVKNNSNFNMKKKFSLLSSIKKYGKTGFILYWSLNAVSLIALYGAIRYEYINKKKILDKVKGTFLENSYNKLIDKIGENKADFAVAYVANYPLDLIRIPLIILILKLFFKKK